MKVDLVNYTFDPERTIAEASWTCYNKDLSNYNDKSIKEIRSFIKSLVKMGHTSVLEHAVFTFRISGVSRALTHQLVRHRIASYSQQSQRYVSYETMEWINPGIPENCEADNVFTKSMKDSHSSYLKLIELGIPQEDARYVLPNAMTTEIVVTMNARALLNFFKERLCRRAQSEIRHLAIRMWEEVIQLAPSVFEDAGPSCILGKCNQGKMSCGEPLSIDKR